MMRWLRKSAGNGILRFFSPIPNKKKTKDPLQTQFSDRAPNDRIQWSIPVRDRLW
jgi:hypothetical protein